MIEAEVMPIEVIMRVEVQGHKALYLWSNIEGLKAIKSPKEPDPEFAQKYLDKVGEDTLMVSYEISESIKIGEASGNPLLISLSHWRCNMKIRKYGYSEFKEPTNLRFAVMVPLYDYEGEGEDRKVKSVTWGFVTDIWVNGRKEWRAENHKPAFLWNDRKSAQGLLYRSCVELHCRLCSRSTRNNGDY